MRISYGSGCALLMVGLFPIACMGVVFPLDFAFFLVAGWIWYLGRVLPEVTIAWGGVAMAGFCLAAFSLGVHVFLRWLYEQFNASAAPRRIVPPWPARWTAALVGGMLLMFVAGMAASGVGHQVGWLVTARAPFLQSDGARGAARRAQSVNNLKQIGLGLHEYHAAYDTFPAGATADRYGELLQSWQTALLPYLEQKVLSDSVDRTIRWDDPRNSPAFQTPVWVFLNPALPERLDNQGYALSHYAGNAHVLGGLEPMSIDKIRDGTSQTIIAGEVAQGYLPWGRPGNWRDPAKGINRAPDGFGSPFPGGANVLFADGSVRFIKETVAPNVLKALGTPAGHDPVDPDVVP